MHPRSRLFAILRRCFQQLGPAWYLLLRNQELFRAMQVQNGESRPAAWLTQQLQLLCAPVLHTLPAGCKVGSHSWREMGCVASYLARYDSLRMANHGFWRDVQTMFKSYIEPFLDVFPYSPFLSRVFDFLRGV